MTTFIETLKKLPKKLEGFEEAAVETIVHAIGLGNVRWFFDAIGQSVEYYDDRDLAVVTDREMDWVKYILFSPTIIVSQLFQSFQDRWCELKIPTENFRGQQVMNSAFNMYVEALKLMSEGECQEEIAFNVFHGHGDIKLDSNVVVENTFGRLADLAIRHGSTDEVISCGDSDEFYKPHVQVMLNEYKKEYLLSRPGKRTEWVVDLITNNDEMSKILKS